MLYMYYYANNNECLEWVYPCKMLCLDFIWHAMIIGCIYLECIVANECTHAYD